MMLTDTPLDLADQYGVYDTHMNYRLIPVFEKTDAATRQVIADLWARNHILPPGTDADARAKQVVFMALNENDEPIAVNTVYIDTLAHTGLAHAPADKFYFYRTFIQPQDRVPYLVRTMFTDTYDYLQSLEITDKPRGLCTVAQNPKLGRRGVQQSMLKLGWEIPGRDYEGNVIYRRDF